MKKSLKNSLFITLSLLMSFCAFQISYANNAPADDITVLYTNDVHTYIDTNDKKTLSYDNIAAMKKQYRKDGKAVLLVDAGDHIQGTAYGGLDEGKAIVSIMEKSGYDLATPGNHEFDYGMKRALEVLKNGKVPYVSSNFISLETNKPVLDPYRIFELNGVKVAFVGISTPETFTKSTPKYFMNAGGKFIYTFKEDNTGKSLYDTVQYAIDSAKKDGADYVIALGHMGDDPSSSPWTSEEVIKNTSGLNAFIDGHSHSTVEKKSVKDKDSNDVILTQTGCYFQSIGKMTIAKDKSINTELVKEYKGSDSEVKNMVDKLKNDVDKKLGEVIAYSSFDMYIVDPKTKQRLIRKQETNLGDFTADAIYYLFDKIENLPVDVAVMNGGGIRADLKKGRITYKNMKEVHTFGNVICLMKVSGQQILDALEWGAKNVGIGEDGGFLHTSGLKFTIDASVKPNVKSDAEGLWTGSNKNAPYRVKDVEVFDKQSQSYKPLDLNKKYNLAGTNYTLRDLGDGFNMFSSATLVKDYVMEDYLALANYAKSFDKDPANNLPAIPAEKYKDINGSGYMKIINLEKSEKQQSENQQENKQDKSSRVQAVKKADGIDNSIAFTIDKPYYVVEVVGGDMVKTLDAAPYISDGKTMLPVRALAESLNTKADWNKDAKTATLTTKEGKVLIITIGQKSMLVDGVSVALDVPAELKENRTFLPMRAIVEALGAKVDWDAGTKKAIITK